METRIPESPKTKSNPNDEIRFGAKLRPTPSPSYSGERVGVRGRTFELRLHCGTSD